MQDMQSNRGSYANHYHEDRNPCPKATLTSHRGRRLEPRDVLQTLRALRNVDHCRMVEWNRLRGYRYNCLGVRTANSIWIRELP